ncbi:MAG: right-handed parallel beta-helix repeat-containing protein, partial [Thermoplasmata archaeon]|nr:right-handed parallel beta-helix repeat-containing protein [Thermoplasmata archaeon]
CDFFLTNAPPDPATSIILTLTGDWDDVNITWTNGTDTDIDYYRVYHSSGGGAWNLVEDFIYRNYSTHNNAANDQYEDAYYVETVDTGELTADSGSATIYEWVVNATNVQPYGVVTIATPNNITVYGELEFEDTTVYCNDIEVKSTGTLRLDTTGAGATVYVRGNIDVYGELDLWRGTLRIHGSADGERHIKLYAGGYMNSTDASGIRSNTTFNYDFWIDGAADLGDISIFDAGYDTGGSRGIRVNSSANTFSLVTIENGGQHGLTLYGDNNQIDNCTIRNNAETGVCINSGSEWNLIEYCNISYHPITYQGILLQGGNNTIRENDIWTEYYAIHSTALTWGNRIENNTMHVNDGNSDAC